MRRRSLLTGATTVCLCLGVGTACGRAVPTPSFASADSIVDEWVAAGTIPGAVLLVGRNGEPVFHRAYGAAEAFTYGAGQYDDPGGIERLADPVLMTPEAVFDLASVTKVMATTMAIMLLVDREDVDIDAPATTYLPDFSGDGRESITVRHLLTHTSGLPQWVPTYYHASSPDEAYRYIRSLPLEWPVGDGHHYSDLGFMLLGRIVETVSGRSLGSFLEDELYGPLGFTATGFRPMNEPGVSPAATDSAARDGPAAVPAPSGRVLVATSHGNPFERRMVHDPDFGYRISGDPNQWDGWRARTLRGEVNDGNAFHAFRGVAGHAGLFSTAEELQTLLELMLSEGEAGGRRFVRPETVRAFLAPALEGQALGWQLPPYAPEGSFGHTGFTGTFVLGVPRDGLTVVLLTNRQNVGVDAETQYPDVAPLQRAVTEAVTRPAG